MSEQKRNNRIKAQQIIKGSAGEPALSQDNYHINIHNALNWYNANQEYKEIRKYAETYVKHINRADAVYAINKATDLEIRHVGVLGRLLLRGQYLSPEHTKVLHDKIDHLFSIYKKEKAVVVQTVTTAEPILSIQERILESARKYSGESDDAIDEFAKTKSTKFSTKNYLVSNEVSGAVAKRIGEFYKPLAAELGEAVAGTDEQLNEGYSHFTKVQLRKFHEFVQSIVVDCGSRLAATKANRAPRKRKEKPAGVQVAKLQYLAEYPELNLTSVAPYKIIGAMQLWVYNTKNKKLGVYYASGPKGFAVKGTTLQGWDPEISSQNSLRKPAVTLKEALQGGKVVLNKLLSKLTTINTKLNGRINSDTIILRVL